MKDQVGISWARGASPFKTLASDAMGCISCPFSWVFLVMLSSIAGGQVVEVVEIVGVEGRVAVEVGSFFLGECKKLSE